MMTNPKKKIVKILSKVCEDLLPNIRVANIAKVKRALEGVHYIIEAKY